VKFAVGPGRKLRSSEYWRTVSPFGMILLLLVSASFAVVGWLCLFRTDKLVESARKKYDEKRSVRPSLSPGFVLKTWYPTYLRGIGILAWIMLLGLALLVLGVIRLPIPGS
jgi:hypothetical protein